MCQIRLYTYGISLVKCVGSIVGISLFLILDLYKSTGMQFSRNLSHTERIHVSTASTQQTNSSNVKNYRKMMADRFGNLPYKRGLQACVKLNHTYKIVVENYILILNSRNEYVFGFKPFQLD
jgi:hypothetical protein